MLQEGDRDGAAATLVDFGVLYACVALFGTWYLAASALAYAAGCLASYALNRRFTFRDPAPPSAGQFGLFVLVSLVGLLLSLGVIALAVEVFAIGYLSARALALCVAPFANYAGQGRLTFRAPDFYAVPPHHPAETNGMAGRILVAYATKRGSTAAVAEAVVRKLNEAGFEAGAAAFPAVDSLEGYDGVVLGAPLYMGTPLDLAAFVARHRDALKRVPVAAFATGLTPAAPAPKPGQVEQARKALIDALSPVRPIAATLFAGALDPAKMGLAERAVTRLLRAPSRDFRDWNAIGAWARTLVPLLRGGAGTH